MSASLRSSPSVKYVSEEPQTSDPGEQPDAADDDGIFGKSVTGVLWSGLERGGDAVISVVVHIVLARLLAPSYFGLVAMASIVIGFISLIKDQGFNDAIIQREELDPLHLDTAMWAITGFSLVLAAVGVAAAPLVAWGFNEPQLTNVFRVMVLTLPLMSTSTLPTAVLKRDLEFRPLSTRALLSSAFGGGAAVTAAFMGAGVWSLVINVVVKRTISSLVLWKACDWRPRFRFSKAHFRELFSFGAMVTTERVVNFFNRQFDDVMVGAVLGSTALGYYTIAYEILKGMTDILIRTLSSVALPMFSKLQSQTERLRGAYLSAVEMSSLISFPVFLIFFAVSPELFMLVYGPKWMPAVPPARVLAFVGMIHSVALLNGPLYQGRGKLRLSLALTMINGVLNVVGFIVAVYAFGSITAVAASYAIVCYIMVPVEVIFAAKLIGFGAASYLKKLVFPLLAATISVGAILGLKTVVPADWWLVAKILIYLAAGFGVYAVLALGLLPKSSREVVARVRRELLS